MTEVVPKITIKELRARHNLTQEEFAKTVGTTPQTVSAWEKNQLSISPNTTFNRLICTVSDIFYSN